MTISYVYDMQLPTRYAAAIQILNTCHALAEEGIRTRLYVRSLQASPEECLSRYDLTPHDKLTLHPLHGTMTYRFWPRSAVRRLRQPGDQLHYVISRGEPGIMFYQHLRRTALRPYERWIYEAHRPCAGNLEESKIASTEGHLKLPLHRVRQLEKAAVEQASGLVCLTPAVKEALSDLYRLPSSLLFLPSGTSIPSAAPVHDENRDLDIFYAGKLERRKGVMDLIMAMRHLREYRVHIAGGAEDEVADLRRQAQLCEVQSQVSLLGFVQPGRVKSLYARARVGVCPLPSGESEVSERFTSPLKLLDMMAWGVPVVASNIPSIRQIAEDGKTALLVPPNDERALAQAIRHLLENRPFALRLAAAARIVVQQYSWKCRAQRLAGFLAGIS